jgi:hypothetical protein
MSCLPVRGFSFGGHAGRSVEYPVFPHPPNDASSWPLELLLAEDLRRRLREAAVDIEQRAKRLLIADGAANSTDQTPESVKS